MIKHEFESGGFPLTTEHLTSVENQVKHLASFAKLFFGAAGETRVYVPSDFFIISNGQFTGNNAGYVLWQGEIMQVEAATYDSAVATVGFFLQNTSVTKVYADSNSHPYKTIISGSFSSSTTGADATVSAADINLHLLTSLSCIAKKTVGSATKPIYMNAGVPTPCSYELQQTVGASAELTDTKVTAVGNHYAPAEDANAQLSASASGATAAWSIDVVKGVTLKRDAKGHVVGITVSSGKIPANPDSGATSVEVTGTGNAVTTASYSSSTRKLTLTKGATFLTSHQSLASYTPTASMPVIGMLHYNNYGNLSVSYIHLLGNTVSLSSYAFASNTIKLKFSASKRWLLIPMAHGAPQSSPMSSTLGTVGYSGATNSNYESQNNSWTASQYAALYCSAAFQTILVIGY